MTHTTTKLLTRVVVAAVLGVAPHASAITLGQSETFAASAAGWGNNGGSALHVATGGADGPADGYLELTTTGNFAGASSRLITETSPSWLGDYISAGVSAISLQANNFSSADVHLRLSFRSFTTGDASVFVTKEQVLPANSGWTGLLFDLSLSNMDRLGVDYAATFSGVDLMRVIHRYDPTMSNGGPPDAGDTVLDGLGSPVAARVGIDGVQALAIPEPSAAVLASLPVGGLFRRRLRSHSCRA